MEGKIMKNYYKLIEVTKKMQSSAEISTEHLKQINGQTFKYQTFFGSQLSNKFTISQSIDINLTLKPYFDIKQGQNKPKINNETNQSKVVKPKNQTKNVQSKLMKEEKKREQKNINNVNKDKHQKVQKTTLMVKLKEQFKFQQQRSYSDVDEIETTCNLGDDYVIEKIDLAYDLSFLMAVHKDGYWYCIHIQRDGKVSILLKLRQSLNRKHLMASQEQLIILNKQTGKMLKTTLISINIRNKTLVSTVIQDQTNSAIQINQLYYFHDNKTLCYCYCNIDPKLTKPRLYKLLHFKLPLSNNDKPFHSDFYQSKSSNRYFVHPKKLNEKSMIGFIPQTSDGLISDQNNIKFDIYNYNQNQNIGKVQSFAVNLSSVTESSKVDIALSDIWETSPNILYIQLQTKQHEDQIKAQQEIQRNHSFYLYMNENKIEIAHMNLPHRHRLQFINSIRPFDISQLQFVDYKACLKQNKTNNIKQCQNECAFVMPVYYVHGKTGLILATIKGSAQNKYKAISHWSNHNNRFMIQSQEFKNQTIIRVKQLPKIWRIYEYGVPTIIAFFLAQLFNDWDEDISYEVCNLCRQQIQPKLTTEL